jgi:hypothetical protein
MIIAWLTPQLICAENGGSEIIPFTYHNKAMFLITRAVLEDYTNLQFENIQLKEIIALHENKIKLFTGMDREIEKYRIQNKALWVTVQIESIILLGIISGLVSFAVVTSQ